MKKLTVILCVAVMAVSMTGCGDGNKESKKEPAIKTVAELTNQSGVAMADPEEAEEVAYQVVDEATAQIQYKNGEVSYTFLGAKSDDWKTVSGSTEEFIGEPAIRKVKCNGDKSELQAYISAEGHRAGTWIWNGTTYVLLTENDMEEEDFINRCLDLMKLTYQASVQK